MKTFEEFLVEKRVINTPIEPMKVGDVVDGGIYIGENHEGKSIIVAPKKDEGFGEYKLALAFIKKSDFKELPIMEEMNLMYKHKDILDMESGYYWTGVKATSRSAYVKSFGNIGGSYAEITSQDMWIRSIKRI